MLKTEPQTVATKLIFGRLKQEINITGLSNIIYMNKLIQVKEKE